MYCQRRSADATQPQLLPVPVHPLGDHQACGRHTHCHRIPHEPFQRARFRNVHARQPASHQGRERHQSARQDEPSQRGLPQPKGAKDQQRRRTCDEIHQRTDEVEGRAGVLRDQSHEYGSGAGGPRQQPHPDGSQPRLPSARLHPGPGPGGNTQQSRAQQQRSEEHAQPLDNERGVHQPVQRRADVPAIVDPAVDRAEVADIAGPPVVGLRSCPRADHCSFGGKILQDAQDRPGADVLPGGCCVGDEGCGGSGHRG